MRNISIFILLISAALAAGNVSAQNGAKTLDDLNREKAKLQSIIEQNNKMMEEYSSRKNSEMVRISMIDNKILKRQELIKVYNDEVEAYNQQIRQVNMQIDSVEHEVKKQKDEYANIIRQLQSRGATAQHPLIYILSSQSFNQSYRRFLFMRQYSAYRRDQFQKLNASISSLAKLKGVVSQKLTSINKVLANAKKENEVLNGELAVRKDKVAQFQRSQTDLQAQIMRAESQKQQLEAQIVQVIKEEAERARREAEERRRREAELAKNKDKNKGKQPAADTKEPQSEDIMDNRGRLPWPVRSFVVTSYYGEHDHPLVPSIKVRNNGLDMDVLGSKEIHPVHKGRVSRIIMIPGSTASIIIRHGEVLTVYSNLAEVNVKRDQEVDVYTNLGKVYNGSGLNSNILHFEIWKGGEKQNPEDWLKKQ